jgi:hypothetical protein
MAGSAGAAPDPGRPPSPDPGPAPPASTPYASGVSEPTLSDALTGALDAYERLAGLGEEIEDEWSYVTDLAAAWRDRIEAVDEARGSEAAGAAGPAIERAIDEIERIADPHRAIDWLSTFPQVVLIAAGEQP